MECMLTTNPVIMMHGKHALMQIAMLGPMKRTSDGTPKPADAPTQKLALNDKLQNTFCTQAGVFAEAVDRIWQDVQGNK